VDYIADVWLNGKYLGHHEGYCAPFALSTLGGLRKGTNRLVVRVDSPSSGSRARASPGRRSATRERCWQVLPWRLDVRAVSAGKELSKNFFLFAIGDRRGGGKDEAP
jgi:hypothetical protein